MKNISLLLALMIYSLMLSGDISAKSKVVLTGKMVSKEKEQIKFYLEDHLDGNYTLFLIQENQNNADFLIEKGGVINTVLKLRVWSKLKSCKFKNENNINYLIISFSNEELLKMNYIEILFFGIKTIVEIEKKTNSSIIARLE